MAGEIWRLMNEHDEVYRADDLEDLAEFIELKSGGFEDDDDGGDWF